MADGQAGSALVRNLILASIGLAVVVVLARRARPDRNDCPPEFAQTRLAATLLWSDQSHAWPPPGSGATPEDLVLLEDPGDSDVCAGLAAAIPDTLETRGITAPYLAAFYGVADVYVVPIVPRVTRAEIEAESRGEMAPWRAGVTLVLDGGLTIRSRVPN